MSIDNCTRCDMCSHKKVCKKSEDYEELLKRAKDSLTDRYDCPIDAILDGMNASVTLCCLDFCQEVRVR